MVKPMSLGRLRPLRLTQTVTPTTAGEDYDWDGVGTGDVGLTVQEDDASPTVTNVNTVIFDNAGFTVTDNTDGSVTIGNLGGAGGSLPWFNVQTDGTAVGDGVTDDTTAIQDAIDTATASGTQSATLYFPPGTYLIGGALQDTGAFNGQILLPSVSTSDPQVVIRFVGASPAEFAIHGTIPSPGGYSIIKSTLTGASGTAACISGGNGTYPTQNNVSARFKDLIFLAPTDPTFTMVNISTCQGGGGLFDNVLVWMSSWTNPSSAPTHSNSYGVKLPQWSNSNWSDVPGLMVSSFYTGILQGELVETHAVVALCNVGVELPTSEHASELHVEQTGCTIGVKVTGSHYCDVWYDEEFYDSGHFPSWQETTYQLSDASNYGKGSFRWFRLYGVTQVPINTISVNGGTGWWVEQIGQTRSANTVLAGPTTGSAAVPAYRALVAADLPATAVTPGSYTLASITVDAAGRLTAASSGTATSGGTDHTHIVDEQFSGDASTTLFVLSNSAVPDSVMAYVGGTRTPVTLGGAMNDEITFGSAPGSGTDNISVDYAAATS